MSAQDALFDTSDPTEAPNHVLPADGHRCQVCGMGAHQCTGVPATVVERMRRFIDAYGSLEGWQFAKTMADIPHSYAVRERAARIRLIRDVPVDGAPIAEVTDGEAEFVWFAEAIRQYGYRRRWSGGKAFHYVNIDGWRYWTMGNPIDPTPGSKKTCILNRAPLTREGQEQLRRENGFVNVRWFECENGHRFGLVIETFEGPTARTPGEALGCPACGPNHADCVEVDGPQ